MEKEQLEPSLAERTVWFSTGVSRVFGTERRDTWCGSRIRPPSSMRG